MQDFSMHLEQCKSNETIKEMKDYAIDNGVPIINDAGLEFLLKSVFDNKPKRILEIGCAIGYSACLMSMVGGCYVDTIERDEKMYNMAKHYIKKLNLEDKVSVLLDDALNLGLDRLSSEYDMIFIDAAKAQYQKFFEKYEVLLPMGGIVVCDNLSFHDLTNASEENLSKNVRGLVRKLNAFKDWLRNNYNYDTKIYEAIGDGVSISRKL